MARKRKNRYKERIEKGNYTKIPNEILEAVYAHDFARNENKVFWFIMRKTWGWEKDREVISLEIFEENTSLSRISVSEALRTLQQRRIITKNGKNIYEIQMDIDKWLPRKKRKEKLESKNLTENGKTLTENGKKLSLNRSINKEQRAPKKTILKETKHHQTKNDDDSLLLLKPKTLRILTGKTFRLGQKEVARLLAITKRKNVNNYFCTWIDYILSDPRVKDPGPYFKKVVKEGSEPKPTLEFARRVKLFNSFTSKQVRAENSTAFENMIEREVLKKAEWKIKEINHIYSRENEEEIRQKKKTNLIYHVCAVIKPSRLKRFKKKLLKVDPGNNFRQVIEGGYELHLKQVYSDSEDLQIL